jgi:DUF4097 and DUF4098 domain-containing protein YvlB
VNVGYAGSTDVETKDFAASAIRTLEVQNGNGDVKIISTSSNKASVTVTKIEFVEACRLIVELNGKTLVTKVDRPDSIPGKRCKVNFAISVPANTTLDLATGSGDIDLVGMNGELTFRTGSGDIQGKAELTKITGRTGSGDVELSGLVGPAEIHSGSGDIKLTYKTIPARGGLELMTASGSSEIILPREAKISTLFLAGSGTLQNELGESPKASFRIIGRSGSGDMKIKKGTL